LNEETLEVYRIPDNGSYAERHVLQADAKVQPLIAVDKGLTVKDMLPYTRLRGSSYIKLELPSRGT
jgi:Uma2 family endonuclease